MRAQAGRRSHDLASRRRAVRAPRPPPTPTSRTSEAAAARTSEYRAGFSYSWGLDGCGRARAFCVSARPACAKRDALLGLRRAVPGFILIRRKCSGAATHRHVSEWAEGRARTRSSRRRRPRTIRSAAHAGARARTLLVPPTLKPAHHFSCRPRRTLLAPTTPRRTLRSGAYARDAPHARQRHAQCGEALPTPTPDLRSAHDGARARTLPRARRPRRCPRPDAHRGRRRPRRTFDPPPTTVPGRFDAGRFDPQAHRTLLVPPTPTRGRFDPDASRAADV